MAKVDIDALYVERLRGMSRDELVAEAAEQSRRARTGRERLGAVWGQYLDLLMEERLDGGISVLEYVLATNSELRRRLTAALQVRT